MSEMSILKIIAPLIAIQLVLMIFCLIRLKKDKAKYLPKWGWALIIIFGELWGPIVYLLIGRDGE
ncbi:MAG TPA: hypothetical protein DEF85_07195 [Clostridiaceae bacterium]|nr:hypothetical protein [Clostridiaceae bacterium]